MSFFEYVILTSVSLFVIIDPISAVPVFLAMTPQNTPTERERFSRTACIVGTIILFFIAVSGQFIFAVMGITLPAFQIAGGIFIFIIAIDMLKAQDSEGKFTSAEREVGVRKDDIAVTPLAIPLLVGPGAISTVLLIKSEARGWEQHLVLYFTIFAVMAVTYIILRLASHGAQWLSPLFLKVTQRLMGLLLAALAVQFVLNGLMAAELKFG